MGIGVSVASISLGATVIEKHFTIDRDDGGIDSKFSMEPNEMKQLVVESARASEALGHICFGPTESEIESLKYRRSLYVVKDLNAGDILTTENIRAIRPGLGLQTKYIGNILGMKVTRNISRGTPVSWDFFS